MRDVGAFAERTPNNAERDTNMNRDLVEGNLKQFSGILREQWGRLLGDEAGAAAGRRDQLAGSMQVRRAIAQVEASRQFRDFLDRNRDWDISGRRSRL